MSVTGRCGRRISASFLLLCLICTGHATRVFAESPMRDGYWVREWYHPAISLGYVLPRYEYLHLRNGRFEDGYAAGVIHQDAECQPPEKAKNCRTDRRFPQFKGKFSFDGDTLMVSDVKRTNKPFPDRPNLEAGMMPFLPSTACCRYKVQGSASKVLMLAIDLDGSSLFFNGTYLHFSEPQFLATTALVFNLDEALTDFGQCALVGSHRAYLAKREQTADAQQRDLLDILSVVSLSARLDDALAVSSAIEDPEERKRVYREAWSRYLAYRMVSKNKSVDNAEFAELRNKTFPMLGLNESVPRTASFVNEIENLRPAFVKFHELKAKVQKDKYKAFEEKVCPGHSIPRLH